MKQHFFKKRHQLHAESAHFLRSNSMVQVAQDPRCPLEGVHLALAETEKAKIAGEDFRFFCPFLFETGSTISTLLHDRINPKDCQVLSLGDTGFLQFFRVVSRDYGKPREMFQKEPAKRSSGSGWGFKM